MIFMPGAVVIDVEECTGWQAASTIDNASCGHQKAYSWTMIHHHRHSHNINSGGGDHRQSQKGRCQTGLVWEISWGARVLDLWPALPLRSIFLLRTSAASDWWTAFLQCLVPATRPCNPERCHETPLCVCTSGLMRPVETKPSCWSCGSWPSFRKLEKAVAVSGVWSGLSEENSGKVQGQLREKLFRSAKCYKFLDFGHRERQTCREPWVDTAWTLSPPSVRVFLKSAFQPSRVALCLLEQSAVNIVVVGCPDPNWSLLSSGGDAKGNTCECSFPRLFGFPQDSPPTFWAEAIPGKIKFKGRKRTINLNVHVGVFGGCEREHKNVFWIIFWHSHSWHQITFP